jgi:maltodextrin utilization protein YvdJ
VIQRVVLLLCPVWYAPTDAVVRESLNLGIFVLLGVTRVVLAAIARFMVAIARRSREAAQHDVENV